MSGIAGVVMPAGRAVDERLLLRMTASMAGRGPDGQHTWIAGGIGLAHALLCTGERSSAPLPATLDGCVWITADARVDGRAGLIRALEAAGRTDLASSGDAQLILHAYHVWGEHCVDHLLGDFVFAIWDGPAQRVFCARDHFGVKPFYYAQADGGFVFSNTLDCVRLHPAVSDALNELSVADFLLFGFNQDTTATAFAGVRRLPPGHMISGAADALCVRRYWSLPADGRIRYRQPRDYVDHFAGLLREAVGDRISGTATAIWMSGGLDSTAIAASARQVLASRDARFDLQAHTVVYDALIADQERRYAALAAGAVGIAPRYWIADDALPFDGWDQPGFHTPEPIDDPYYTFRLRQLDDVGAGSRTVLSGDGGDEGLWRSCVVDLVGKMPVLELGADIARCVLLHGRRPAGGLRAKLQAWWKSDAEPSPLPNWLDADFVDRWNLRRRVQDGVASPGTSPHPLRPDAYRRLSSPIWPAYLEAVDPGFTGVPVEHRWPFLDLRLVNYLLAIPPLPWCVDKRLLRLAMRDSLPEALLRRKKSPLASDPLHAHLQAADWLWLDRFEAAPQLARFVNRKALLPVADLIASQNPWLDLRPFCLNYWLSRLNGHAS